MGHWSHRSSNYMMSANLLPPVVGASERGGDRTPIALFIHRWGKELEQVCVISNHVSERLSRGAWQVGPSLVEDSLDKVYTRGQAESDV